MKKFIIILACALVLACSGTYPAGYSPVLGEMAAALARDPDTDDPGLVMFRDPRSRRAVEGYYDEVTGNPDVCRAILRHANAYDIPLPLAFALAWGESEYNLRAVNRNPRSVDRGLFQLNSRTFPKLTEEDFFDPDLNARYGLRHLRFCLNEASSELVALAIYNAGTLKVRKGTPYSTLNHIAKILEYREILEDDYLRTLGGEVPRLARRPAGAADSL